MSRENNELEGKEENAFDRIIDFQSQNVDIG